MNQDHELIQLRNQLIKLCPDEVSQIIIMDKNDLKDLLAIVISNNSNKRAANTMNDPAIINPNNENGMINSNGKLSREAMQIKILESCPGMLNELNDLVYEDIQEIYIKCIEKEKEDQQQKMKIQNTEINISDMKKVLLEKLPAYQNKIRSLQDNEIISMYHQLMDEIKSQTSDKIQYPDLTKVNFMNSHSSYPTQQKKPNKKQKPEPPTPPQTNPNNNQQLEQDKFLKVKETKKQRKLKHKCKISFYFNESDFEDEKVQISGDGATRRQAIVSNIVDKLYTALSAQKNVNRGQSSGKSGEICDGGVK